MLQDPNVERYVANALKPVLKQIKELKAEIKELKKALHKTDCSTSVCPDCGGTGDISGKSQNTLVRGKLRRTLKALVQ